MKKTTAILLTAIITTSSYVVFANEGILNSTESTEASASPTAIVTVEEYTGGEVDAHIVLSQNELAEIIEELTAVENQLNEIEEAVVAIKEELEALNNTAEITEVDSIAANKSYDKLTKKLSQLESLLAKMQVVYAKVPAEAKPAIEAKIKKTELRISNIKHMLAIVEEAKAEIALEVEGTTEPLEVNNEALNKSYKDIKNELKELKTELKECKSEIKSLNKELKEYKSLKDAKKAVKEDKKIIKEDKKNNSSQELFKADEAKIKAVENREQVEIKGNKKGIKGDK